MASRGRPKADRTYSVMLRVRVAPEHDELIRQASDSAARRKGSGDMSSWIRETPVAAAPRGAERRAAGGGSGTGGVRRVGAHAAAERKGGGGEEWPRPPLAPGGIRERANPGRNS